VWSSSDEALLAGLASGDSDAATAFVRRFQARVFGLAQSMVDDRAVAEEIAQETFLRAWKHGAAYDARRGQVATWLLAIARNLAIDRLRVKRSDPFEPDRLVAMVEAGWRARGGTGQPDLDRGDVHDAVATLPEDQRRALVLSAVFGFTAREIGEMDGAPLGTTKTRIRSALLKLRATLEASDER
jgi:RNA polymerase sigma-70 factor (ECF subfamily)